MKEADAIHAAMGEAKEAVSNLFEPYFGEFCDRFSLTYSSDEVHSAHSLSPSKSHAHRPSTIKK